MPTHSIFFFSLFFQLPAVESRTVFCFVFAFFLFYCLPLGPGYQYFLYHNLQELYRLYPSGEVSGLLRRSLTRSGTATCLPIIALCPVGRDKDFGCA